MLAGPTRGKLLIALPALADPNFDRTVVYVLEHNDDGSFGLVLNRPTIDEPAGALEGWTAHLAVPRYVFTGGPVQAEAFVGLAQVDGEPANDEWATLGDGLGTVDLSAEPSEFADRLGLLRIFQGYSGWAAGQLDDELAVGAWLVVDAAPTDLFTPEPADLWRTVLRRQPGRTAWMAEFPDDLSLN